jgi:hypothetical protein
MTGKVKTLCLAAVLALSGVFGARGAAAEAPQPALRLTAEVVGRRYCAGNKLNILQLSIRLRYQNAGSQKLIVYRGKNFFYQTRIRGGTGAAPSRPYEVVVTNSRFNDAQAEDVNGRKPGSAFVTLSPGGTYETTVVVGVGVTPEGFERFPNSVAPGEHTLQLIVSSWYESRKLAEEMRARWQGAGLLWIDPVATQPLKFVAGDDAPAAACR